MNVSTIFGILYTISAVVSITLLVFIAKPHISILIQRLRTKKQIEEAESLKLEDVASPNRDRHVRRLHDLRRFNYAGFEDLKNIEYEMFFIGEPENEALGLFISVSPNVLELLTKIEHMLIKIEEDLEGSSTNLEDLQQQLIKINNSLESLDTVTNSLFDRIRDLYESNQDRVSEVPIKPEVVKGYISIASNMVGFAFNYIRINGLVCQKVHLLNPILDEQMYQATSKFLNIFFVDLMSCIGLIDESIETYK